MTGRDVVVWKPRVMFSKDPGQIGPIALQNMSMMFRSLKSRPHDGLAAHLSA